MQQGYRFDLAYIHDAGFGHLAANAAPMVIGALKQAGIQSGTVVELGCGSGISSRLFLEAGYSVVGIDLSPHFIEMARKRAPEATFRVGSFATEDIPPCVAVTAIGEVFNYTFDTANGAAVRTEVMRRIHGALAPRGLLVFDMATPARAPSRNPERTFVEGADWTVLAEAESDAEKSLLTRRITTFLKVGDRYRRDSEVHHLDLVEPAQTVESLQRIGFSVQILDAYGPLPLPRGLVGFMAGKPRGAGNE